jgi:glycosyltransferase involved in cell wall biosynthesis
MKTAITIPTFKRAAMVERLLVNMRRCAFPPDVEIYVVENGPVCGVEDICKACALDVPVRYLYWPVAGKSLALNYAINCNTADFLIFLDDDIRISADAVEAYIEAAHRHGPGSFFGGPLLVDAEIQCPPHLVAHLPRSAKGWWPGDHEMEMEKSKFEYFFGANWAVFRSDLTSNLFAEHLGVTAGTYSPLGEEVEIQRRLIGAFVKAIYLPRAIVHHTVSKECYTIEWVVNRAFREGITDWILTQRAEQEYWRKLFGIPTWLIRAAIEQSVKARISRFRHLPIELCTEIKVREAYLHGLAYGAWRE